MLKDAFKEWAVICKALAEGKQAVILRKGGIAEEGGAFRVEHTRFWLFPTYVHQQGSGIKSELHTLLEQAEVEKPPAGMIRLSHFAEVTGIYHLHDMVGALLLGPIADTDQLKGFSEAVLNPRNHVREESACEAVHRAVTRLVARTRYDQATIFEMQADLRVDSPVKVSPWPRHFHVRAIYLDLHSRCQWDRQLTYA